MILSYYRTYLHNAEQATSMNKGHMLTTLKYRYDAYLQESQ